MCDLFRLLRPISVNARNQVVSPGSMGSRELERGLHARAILIWARASNQSHKFSEKRAGSFSLRLVCSTDTNKNFDDVTHHVQMLFMLSTGIFRMSKLKTVLKDVIVEEYLLVFFQLNVRNERYKVCTKQRGTKQRGAMWTDGTRTHSVHPWQGWIQWGRLSSQIN